MSHRTSAKPFLSIWKYLLSFLLRMNDASTVGLSAPSFIMGDKTAVMRNGDVSDVRKAFGMIMRKYDVFTLTTASPFVDHANCVPSCNWPDLAGTYDGSSLYIRMNGPRRHSVVRFLLGLVYFTPTVGHHRSKGHTFFFFRA